MSSKCKNSQKLIDRYSERYAPLVKEFCDTLLKGRQAEAYHGIPHPFLPCFGDRFEKSMVKMAIIGRDTRGWNPFMPEFLTTYNKNNYIRADMEEFQNLDYVGWSGCRYTFWGFAMFFLSALYGVKNWELMKQKEHSEILRSFVWGNTNSVEYWEATSEGKGADHEAWQIAKNASRSFDNIQHLTRLFSLDVAIIMCARGDCNNYLHDSGAELLEDENGIRLYQLGKCLVFNMPHPNAMRFNCGADFYAKKIRTELKLRGLMEEMPEFTRMGADSAKLEKYLYDHTPCDKGVYEAIAFIANEMKKQNATMTVPLLFKIINELGFKTTYGDEYQAGRGSYRVISCAYWQYYNEGDKDIAHAIAVAFKRPNGEYAYEC